MSSDIATVSSGQCFDITKVLRIQQDFFSVATLYLTKTHNVSDTDLFDFVKQSVTMENVPVNVN
jgi:hypothetical protein